MAVDDSLVPGGEHGPIISTEVVALSLPSDGQFVNVARLVVGGLAVRNDLSYESLDDLQLAVESILREHGLFATPETTLEVRLATREIDVLLGPVDVSALDNALGHADGIGLRVVLDAVVDTVALEERGHETWLRLEKHVPVPGQL